MAKNIFCHQLHMPSVLKTFLVFFLCIACSGLIVRQVNGAVVGQKSDALLVNELINTKYTSENDRRIAVSKKLERLNRQQLESIKNILQDDFSSNYTVPAGNSAMGQRFVYWLGNAIDDRLGTLSHDRILEGHIGLITGTLDR